MIINEKVDELIVVGEDTSKKAKISSDKLAKLQYLLTEGLYKDPITAVIAEWTNNGIDSVVQAGKDPVESPVLVKIYKDTNGMYVFRVEDKGIGLNDRDFEDICMNYLESTKEQDNDTIGHFGIGMKSFLALERPATFNCVKNGVRRRYVVYKGEEFVNFDLVYQEPTEDENGVVAELTIKDWSEKNDFVSKAKSKLAYYDTAVLMVDGVIEQNHIYRNELFQWSDWKKDQMHIALKDVYYPIDWEAMKIKPIPIGVAIRIGLGEGMTPTPSRESYITNDKTKALILKKIAEIADWFVNRYNATVESFPDFTMAYDYINKWTHVVRLEGREFEIDSLLGYTKLTFAEVKIKGVSLMKPSFYKNNVNHLVHGLTIAGLKTAKGAITSSDRNIKWINIPSRIFDKHATTVLVADVLRGNVKEYLRDKYKPETLFIRKKNWVRPMKYVPALPGQPYVSDMSYIGILSLNSRPVNERSDYVKEWDLVESSIPCNFIDETDVENTKDYKDWLQVRQDTLKALRVKKGYSRLAKATGEMTLAYSYERYGKIHFKKGVYKVEDLLKKQFLTVLITEKDNVDLAKDIIYHMKHEDRVKFALVGVLEKKKLPDHFQFINFKDFMSRNCKPFLRLASAIKFHDALKELDEISNFKGGIFDLAFRKLKKDRKILQDYVDKHYNPYGWGAGMKDIILDAADKHGLYDRLLWEHYVRIKEAIENYDFVKLINVPSYTNNELTRRYERMIYQIMIYRKQHGKEMPEGVNLKFEKVNDKQDEVV